jgi:hypothetical protein
VPAASPEDVRAAVHAMADGIARDVSRDGPTGWLPHFAHVTGFFWATDGAVVIHDADAADAFVRSFAQQVPRVSLAWSDVRVEPIAPDAAVLAASAHEVLTQADGKSTTWDGYFTGTAVRTARGWQLRDGHWSRKPEAAGDARPPPAFGEPLPKVRSGKVTVSGPLAESAVRTVVELRIPALDDCYHWGALEHPGLRGRVVARFVVRTSGTVGMTSGAGELPELVTLCMLRTIESATFQPPPPDIVSVEYELSFEPK